jgi:putative ATP-binding cassette transporter
MAVVERLTSFGDAMTRAKLAAESEAGIELVPGPADRLAMEDVHIRLPNGALLVDRVDLAIRRGEAVLLTGPSGSGKTTLFRALGGLWPFGRGRIHLPEGARVLFLPQKPYLPIGTLKQVLCYPERADRTDDETCREVLEAVMLGHLAGRLGDTDNWSLALSVGEQQRLAFARAFLYRPDWIFIDEGTSALDAGLARHMYALLKKRLHDATILSIAHDMTVAEFHDRHLGFDPERHAIEDLGAAESLATA